MVDSVFQPFAFQTNAFQTGPVVTTLTADAGSYTLTGQDILFLSGNRVDLLAGSYTFTGQPASLVREYSLLSDAGSYTFTGQASTLTYGKKITASGTSYTLTGKAAVLLQTHTDNFAPGFYPVSGQNASLKKASILNTSYSQNERVFQQDAFQENMVQITSSQNDLKLMGQDAFFNYRKNVRRVHVVV